MGVSLDVVKHCIPVLTLTSTPWTPLTSSLLFPASSRRRRWEEGSCAKLTDRRILIHHGHWLPRLLHHWLLLLLLLLWHGHIEGQHVVSWEAHRGVGSNLVNLLDTCLDGIQLGFQTKEIINGIIL